MSLVPDVSQRKFLESAVTRYEGALDEAAGWLTARGLTKEIAQRYRLGVVTEPYSAHEQYRGRLCIPYLTRAGVVTVRFRALDDSTPKYMSLPRDTARIFNSPALFSTSDRIVITEGEFDAIIVNEFTGVPAVGFPGASSWRSVFAKCFSGYKDVVVVGDGDEAGRKFIASVMESVENSRGVYLGEGQDCNSLFVEQGPFDLMKALGI